LVYYKSGRILRPVRPEFSLPLSEAFEVPEVKEFGIKYGVTEPKDREMIRFRLDVAVVKLYRITKE
jgi:hypothetical protein